MSQKQDVQSISIEFIVSSGKNSIVIRGKHAGIVSLIAHIIHLTKQCTQNINRDTEIHNHEKTETHER
jgi:hypothetical protein